MPDDRNKNDLPTSTSPVAFSYIRFSSRPQEEGDSIRRQGTGAKDWATRNKIRLDTSLKIDKGVSAFKGMNADVGSLGEFLKMVEGGRIARGSYLVVESLDRLTREAVQPALHKMLGLTQAGIRIVQLTPVEIVYDDRSDAMALIMMIMELMRGNSESQVKSERVGAAWANKRQAVKEGKTQPPRRSNGKVTMSQTDRLPQWVQEEDGKLVAIPERAKVIKDIYALATEGYGYVSIIKKLEADKVPPFGRLLTKNEIEEHRGKRKEQGEPLTREEQAALKGLGYWRKRNGSKDQDSKVWVWTPARWTHPYIVDILNDKRAMGEYQPCTRGKPDGPPIKDYYPEVVSQDEYDAARRAIDDRRQKVTVKNGDRNGRVSDTPKYRVGKYVNLFAGLIKNARDGGSYIAATNRRRVLVTASIKEGRGQSWSFPLSVFERAVLTELAEIKPSDIVTCEDGADEVLALSAEVAKVKANLAELNADLDANGYSKTLSEQARKSETRLAELDSELSQARYKVAHPLTDSWQQMKTLVGMLDKATEMDKVKGKAKDTDKELHDLRLRLRVRLREIVREIRLLVVPQGLDRLAYVQFIFNGGGSVRTYRDEVDGGWVPGDEQIRTYLMVYRAAAHHRKGLWWVTSIKQPDAMMSGIPFGSEDLRNPDDVALMESSLLSYDREDIDRLLKKGQPLPE